MLDTLQSLRLLDFIDIALVSIVIYHIIQLIRGTRAVQMLGGIAMIIIAYYFSGKLELQTLHWLLQIVLNSLLVLIVILFQSDIRRALTQVGKTPFYKTINIAEKNLEEIVRAASYMAKRRIGALMVIERGVGLRDYLDTGFRIDARIRAELLVSIFLPAAPMHDGGVIINRGKIHSAGCLLPLSQNPDINKRYGTRHRAALGLSEETDAVVIVVSEETQEMSLVRQGTITGFHDENDLADALKRLLLSTKKKKKFWAAWLDSEVMR